MTQFINTLINQNQSQKENSNIKFFDKTYKLIIAEPFIIDNLVLEKITTDRILLGNIDILLFL